ncbi:MAG: ATP synthase F1 subunit gamma [Bacteriovoracaceae bacterium]|nr:ATP synthase F1 subunit gamma [Bacteroidota bacterium]
MATLREIRQRISGVKSTQKITKAMKMVAAAKLRRATDAIIAARPYARKMQELLSYLSGQVDVTKYPQFEAREVKSVAIVIVTADRGLCGAFNSNIIKAAVNHITTHYAEMNAAGKVKLICVGKKGYDFFSKRDYEVIAKHIGVYNQMSFTTAKTIVAEIVDGFVKGEYDKVEIISNEFKNAVQQKLTIGQFLPVVQEQVIKTKTNATDYIFEPTSDEIVSALIPKHLNFQVWRVLLDSNAAEHGARMSAMENASTNARDLIKVLQLTYNKARQAAITKELLEIVAGAEALKKAG